MRNIILYIYIYSRPIRELHRRLLRVAVAVVRRRLAPKADGASKRFFARRWPQFDRGLAGP